MLELEYVLTQLRDEIKFAVAARAKELKKFWGVPRLDPYCKITQFPIPLGC